MSIVHNPFEGQPLYYPVEIRIEILNGAVKCGMFIPTYENPTNPDDKKLMEYLERDITKSLETFHREKRRGEEAMKLGQSKGPKLIE